MLDQEGGFAQGGGGHADADAGAQLKALAVEGVGIGFQCPLHRVRRGQQCFLAGEAQQDREDGVAEPGRDRVGAQSGLQTFGGLFDDLVGRGHIMAFDHMQVVQGDQHDRHRLSIDLDGDQRSFQVGEEVRTVVQTTNGIPVADLAQLAVQAVPLPQALGNGREQ